MPRGSREQSKTGMYRVVLRGNERREIFIEDEDWHIDIKEETVLEYAGRFLREKGQEADSVGGR
ncbi:MAG: hypothetical protein ACOY31_07805 [Bacillota bacterium]